MRIFETHVSLSWKEVWAFWIDKLFFLIQKDGQIANDSKEFSGYYMKENIFFNSLNFFFTLVYLSSSILYATS